MRRNNSNRGRGGKFGNTPGPLLTNHLRDIDLELELLQRKREIYQQEQDMLNRFSNSNKRQYDNQRPFYAYEQPTQSSHYSANYDSNAYESGSSYNSRPQAIKRQATTPWQNQNPSPPKRFNDQQRVNPWQNPEPNQDYRPNQNFNSQPKVFSGQLRPLMNIKPSIGQRIRKFVPQPQKNFKPNKVIKPKNKNVAEDFKKFESNKVIAQTVKSVSKEAAPQGPKKLIPQDIILRSHKPPSVQLKGRLELALGTIVKSVKTLCTDPTTLDYFMIPFIQRVIKHTIRTRIRDVMMNEPVESVAFIVEKYRQKYPEESDVELMKVAEDAHKFNAKNQYVLQLVEADEPEEFFTRNLTKLLSDKLDQAFDELKNVYENKTYDFDGQVENFPKESDCTSDVQIQENPDGFVVEDVIRDRHRTPVISVDVKTITEQLEDKSTKTKKYVEFMDQIIESRLPKILPRYKDMIMSILCIDKEFLSMKAFVTNEIKHKLKKTMETGEKVITIDDDSDPSKSAPPLKNKIYHKNSNVALAKTTAAPGTTAATLKTAAAPGETTAAPAKTTSTTPSTTAGQTIAAPRKTATTPASATAASANSTAATANTTPANNETPVASTITINIEPSETTKDVAAATTDEAAVVTSPIPSTEPIAPAPESIAPVAITPTVSKQTAPKTPAKDAEKSIPSTPKTPASTNMQYVKLIGRPSLPARNDIYDFLNKFKPASIKKHKTINNLLVVGFSDKEGVEKILKANESIVGDATILIKASEQVNNTPVQNKANIQEKTIGVQKNPTEQETNDSETEIKVKTPVEDKSPDESDQLNTSDDNIIPSDLDNQISDLLSSIRKADQEGDTSGVTCDEPMTDTKMEIKNKSEENDIAVMDVTDTKMEIKNDDIAIDITGDVDEKKVPGEFQKSAKDLETIIEIDDDTPAEAKKAKSVEEVAKANLRESGRATPTRSSSRLATITPSTIKTRRASRLANNN